MNGNLKKVLFIILSFVSSTAIVFAQDHTHQHALNEIGISSGGSYSFEHKGWGLGTHIHYFRTLNPHSKWSVGAGVEYIKSDDAHISVEAGVNYRLFERFSIGLLPSLTFTEEEDDDSHSHSHDKKVFPGIHIEAIYDLIHFDKFHLGPSLDYSISEYDRHFSIGVHFAYCF